MADPADDRAAYREALARAEAAAEVVQVLEETPAPSPGELPEAVPVAASDQPLPAEPVAPAEPAAADTPAEATATAPTETVDQLRERLAQAEARLAEKDSFIGRQSSEVGELRKAVEQLQQDVSTAVQPAPAPQQFVPITQDLIDDNPGYAAQLAYDQQNPDLLARAFEVWKEEDPFAASSWRSDKLLEQRDAQFQAELAARDAQLQSIQQPQQAAVEQQVWSQAFAAVQAAHPDFLTVDEATGRSNAQRILEDVAPKYDVLVAQLDSGDAAAKAQVLTLLYQIDRAENLNPESFREQLAQEAAAAAAEEAATRGAAAGVVSQTTVGQSGVEKTPDELERERYVTRMDSKVGLSKGWTGRTS